MNEDVWVLGGGGHAKVVIATLQSFGVSIAGIFDDDERKVGKDLLGADIIGPTPNRSWWSKEARRAIIAIGDNRRREKLSQLAASWVIAQHENAVVHSSVTVGRGSLICAGAVIQPDAQIGAHVIANTSCSIDHDCRIDDFVHIGPGARLAGNVTVGERSFIGAGATIVPGVCVASDVTVGAGAVVLNDVAPGQTVVGVPAREVDNG
jgi:sugar O-acyltransferase (sialic acid O-acetyltransferase NeuD family)